jgi:hypothetical protein
MLHFGFMLGLFFASENLGATGFSKTSVDFQRTTRNYVAEDRILHNHRCENLMSYINQIVFVTETYCVFCEVGGEFLSITSHRAHILSRFELVTDI